MQRHEVQLRGAESWGGGGWGRTASAPPAGAFESSGGVVPSRVRVAGMSGAGDHKGRAGDHKGRAGDHKGRAGDHKGRAGDHKGRPYGPVSRTCK